MTCFSIWCHGEKEFQLFIENLIVAHPTIKFTVEWPHDSIHLDMCDPEIWDPFYKYLQEDHKYDCSN